MDKKIQTDGIIFDVDGTLWDSTESVAAAWNEILDVFSEDFPASPIVQVLGNH